LGIIDEMQEGSIFGDKYVPRGTLLWNGYAQYLVCCGKLFLVEARQGVGWDLAERTDRTGKGRGMEVVKGRGLFSILM
jgi:hypothetical protein